MLDYVLHTIINQILHSGIKKSETGGQGLSVEIELYPFLSNIYLILHTKSHDPDFM